MIPERYDTFYKQRSGLFIRRFYDIADYRMGYLINVFGIFKLLKLKVSKVMDAEDYIIVMSIFGYEFVIR
jgi:hypothetical protein